MAKTAATKKLMEEEGASMREAERWLDTNAFLDKCPHWGHCMLYCPFLIHWMFTHTTQGERNMTGPLARVSDSPPSNKIWGQNHPLWSHWSRDILSLNQGDLQ